jgi:hypothetical protein
MDMKIFLEKHPSTHVSPRGHRKNIQRFPDKREESVFWGWVGLSSVLGIGSGTKWAKLYD